MKKLFQISLMLWFVSTAAAQESPAQTWQKTLRTLHVYDWKDLNMQQKLPGSEIISMDGISVLKIEMTNTAPMAVSLLKITKLT